MDTDTVSASSVGADDGVLHLCQMFPNISDSVIRYVYALSKGDMACATDCFLSGPSIENLIFLLSSMVLMSDSEGCKLRMDRMEIIWLSVCWLFIKGQGMILTVLYECVSVDSQLLTLVE